MSTGSQDAVFHGKLMRIPGALRDALVASGMADPGFLAAYPRADVATLGLQGSHRRRLHGKSALAGETPCIWVLVVGRYVHTLLLFLQFFLYIISLLSHRFFSFSAHLFLCLLPSFALGYFLRHGWLRNGL